MWAEVSSSVPSLLHNGLLVTSIKWRCLLRVLCPVRRTVMTVDCFYIKDSSLVIAVGLRPEINSWACLIVLLRPCHLIICWLSIQCFIFLLFIFCLDTPKDGSGPAVFWIELAGHEWKSSMYFWGGGVDIIPVHIDGLMCVAYLIFLSLKGICDSCWPFAFQPLIDHLPSAGHFPPL